jgi:hypothetical protein
MWEGRMFNLDGRPHPHYGWDAIDYNWRGDIACQKYVDQHGVVRLAVRRFPAKYNPHHVGTFDFQYYENGFDSIAVALPDVSSFAEARKAAEAYLRVVEA